MPVSYTHLDVYKRQLLQIAQEFNFIVITRREVAVSTFRGYRHMILAIPDQNRLAQSRARGDQATIALRSRVTRAQDKDLVGRQLRYLSLIHI